MSAKKYRTQNDLYYSTVYGRGIYEWTGQLVQDPLGGDRGEGRVSPLLTNINTGEQFFLKRMSERGRSQYRRRILTPPRVERILWPSDMVHLDEEQRHACSLFVAQEYAPTPIPESERDESDALLFPYGGYPMMVDGQRKLAQIETPNWKSPAVRDMAVEIARALEGVNRSGYFYSDIHLSRMYFTEQNEVFLDFSNLIYSFRDSVGSAAADICRAESGSYPIEFADPAVVQGLIPCVDLHSQNYSLCALFFYLFLGRYAYDGRLMTGYLDENVQQHYVKFRDYHKMPVFIFDPEDTTNSLGAFWEEQQVIALWEELPAPLRELFVRTLRQKNVKRLKPVNNPTPSTWLRYFEELGWCGENKRTEGLEYEQIGSSL